MPTITICARCASVFIDAHGCTACASGGEDEKTRPVVSHAASERQVGLLNNVRRAGEHYVCLTKAWHTRSEHPLISIEY